MSAARSLYVHYNFSLKQSQLIDDFGEETTIEIETYNLDLTTLDSSIEQERTEENKETEENKWQAEENKHKNPELVIDCQDIN